MLWDHLKNGLDYLSKTSMIYLEWQISQHVYRSKYYGISFCWSFMYKWMCKASCAMNCINMSVQMASSLRYLWDFLGLVEAWWAKIIMGWQEEQLHLPITHSQFQITWRTLFLLDPCQPAHTVILLVLYISKEILLSAERMLP